MMKQDSEDVKSDCTVIKEKVYSLDRIDEVTESEGKSFVEGSESETEYSDSGNEVDDTIDLSQAESKRQDFAEKLEGLMNKFREKTDELISNLVGPVEVLDVPFCHTILPSHSFNATKNKRRKSILPTTPSDSEKLPVIADSTKKEFGLTQSKNKLKKILKQWTTKEEEQDGPRSDDSKRSKEKSKKSKEIQSEILCINDKVLRDEITNLRLTRDFLLEQRKGLDAKFNRDKRYSHYEERRFIELDEAIEAVDTTIEYKNGSICGRKRFEDRDREESDQMLLDRLMKLTEPEMRFLLYKYFQKTIDLRESGMKMEQQIADLDHQVETQAWKIQALSGALQQANAENERRLVMVHREHEEKLHLMFRHYTGTGTSSSADTKTDEPRALPSAPSQIAIPQQNLRKLQGTSLPHTTKVTRQKNKIIIQQARKS